MNRWLKIDKITLSNTKTKLLQKLLSICDMSTKNNRLKGVGTSTRFKKLIELHNERKNIQAFQSDVLEDVADHLLIYLQN